MITISLLFISALYIALLVWVGRTLSGWLVRVPVLLVLLSPILYWVGTYQYVQYEHRRDCKLEGGLKVFIQPEKVDRLRLDALSGEERSEFLLRNFYPRLAVVEAWDGHYTSAGKTGYFAYAPDPATITLPKKDWKFIKTPLSQPTPGLYVLGKADQLENEIEKTTWTLSRNGQLYASWTMFYHYWSRNGAMNIGWRCFYLDAQNKGAELLLPELILKNYQGDTK